MTMYSCSQLLLQCKEDVITKELMKSEQTLQCYAQEFDSHEIVYDPSHTHQVTDRSRSPVLRVDLKPEILPTHETFFLGAAYTHEETGQGLGPPPVPICLLPRREDSPAFDHAGVSLSAERNYWVETQREPHSPSTTPLIRSSV